MKIKNTNQLRKLYSLPTGRAKDKQLISLDAHAINFIEKSPFLVLSTSNHNRKMDASPRGGMPGFVKVADEKTLIVPDAKGNNRLDSLVNIVETGHVGLLFLIPGVDETLRINGNAYISSDVKYHKLFLEENKTPQTCIIISIEELFLHCAKAFMRSKLWQEDIKINRKEFPTMGEMLKDQLGSNEIAETHEDMIKRYAKDL